MRKLAFGILAVLLLYLAAANLQLRQREHFLEERLAAAERKAAPRAAPPPPVEPEPLPIVPTTPAEPKPPTPKSGAAVRPESVPPETARKPAAEFTIDPAQLAGNTFTLKMPKTFRTRDLGLTEVQKKAIDDLKKYRDSETQRYSALSRDIEAQVEDEFRDQANFIHMEIYNDNEIAKGTRPQVNAYRLPSEPWVFVTDAQGKIVARMEGAFSVRELEDAVKKAIGQSP